MITRLKIKAALWDEMQRHVAEQAPLEACGLLAGRDNSAKRLFRVHNAARSRVKFRMDPQEQYNAFMQIEEDGLELVGVYHSHPAGPETVSPTDIAESAYNVVHLIWSCMEGTWNARGFWINGNSVSEVNLDVVQTSNH